MKFIKIFLASSIVEFRDERQQMGNFIRSLNDIYVKRGIYFELAICEDLGESVALERKQQEYNEAIRESQYFYIVFGKSAGKYTIEEFYVALDQFRKSGAPKIFTYFKALPEGEQAEQSVMDFMEQLSSQIGHYYSTFTHLDAIKLDLLLELVKNPETKDQMKFEDGQVIFGDQSVMSLEHVPLYSRNETVQKLVKEQERLNGEFGRLAVEYGKHPEDSGLLKQMMELGEKRSRVRDSLHQMEMDMLGLYSQTEEKRQAGKRLNWREKKAIERVDLGDCEGAKNILRDIQWEQEVGQAEELAEAAVEPVREYISGKRSLISTLLVTGADAETVEEVLAVYERCCALAEKYQVEIKVLYDYARFLYRQKAYPEGIEVAERLERYYLLKPETEETDHAAVLLVLGILYGANGDWKKSEQALGKALAVYRRAAQENPEYQADLATCTHGLAVTLHHLNQLEEEEKLFRESLELRRRLAAENPSAHEEELALACNNLAILVEERNRPEEAKALYHEAQQIYRRLVRTKTNPSEELRAHLAKSCNCLARFLSRLNQMEEAEALYQEALELRLGLMQSNPAVYEPDLASAYHSLGDFMGKRNRPDEAEDMYLKALKIRRRLALANPSAYEPVLAMSCRNLAGLYYNVYRLEEAESLFREALEICRRLAAGDPEAYAADLAGRCIDLGELLEAQKKNSGEREQLYQEGLAVYSRLAERYPETYEPVLSRIYSNLSLFRHNEGRLEEAEKLQRRSLEIRERLASVNPGVHASALAGSCHRLANLLTDRGQYPEAERLYVRALDIFRRLKQTGKDAWQTELMRSCHDLALFYKNRGRHKEAEALYRETWEICYPLSQACPLSYDVYLSPVSFNLAALLKDRGNYEEAIRFCREALAADRRMAAANPGIYAEYPAESGCYLADLLYNRNRKEAEQLYEEALRIYEGKPGKEAEVQRIRKLLGKWM
ncbi:MAG: tetratricopeptide repeat protein [Lachnospiraceae bacterium]|nr:tetratricopeptide repeat protein [Lachnospiraceae bacterium]